ncbi:MAG: helix-turn-helix transcriptional regulator [Candidatus Accumulibacter sp.]|jgi:transcriptional regulator with XRE-family HTH domain|nr:helix-turn-helix transcriptional regulator [Accumulibacter sp.]
MKELGLDQPKMAEKLGLAQPTVSAKLSGKRKISADDAVAFASLLKMSLDELLLGECSEKSKEAPFEAKWQAYEFAAPGCRALIDWVLDDPRSSRTLPFWASDAFRKQISIMIDAANTALEPWEKNHSLKYRQRSG